MMNRADFRVGNLLRVSYYGNVQQAKKDLGEGYSIEKEWRTAIITGVCPPNEPCICWLEEEESNGEESDVAYNRVEPIPITGVQLENRFGFEKGVMKLTGSLVYRIRINGFSIIYEGKQLVPQEIYLNGVSVPMSYIHELQNLCYALSGRELESKK